MKPARNELCACGSGRKYKRCCGAAGAAARPQSRAPGILGPTEAETRQLSGLLDAGRAAEAEQFATQLLSRWPSFGYAWKLLGVAQGMQRKDSLQAMQVAVKLLPHDAEALSNLAVAQRQRGLAAESAATCRAALELSPRLPEAHNNLGNALLDLGEPDAALECYGRAVQLHPGYVDALCNRAELLRSGSRPADAVNVWIQALKVSPNHAPAHAGLGSALSDMGRYEEALEAYRRALQLDPTNAEVALALAMVLRPLGNYRDAEELATRVLTALPDHAPALTFLGSIREDQGQFPAAVELYRRALAVSADFPQASIALGRHCHDSAEEEEWLAAATRLETLALAPRQAIGLQYALGDFHDARQRHEQAYTHYSAANEMTRRSGLRYERERFTAQFTRIPTVYDAAWVNSAAASGNAATDPVFIVGMPRSGTTLAEQILASHPRVFGAGEAVFWLTAATSHDGALDEGTADQALRERMAAEYLRMLRKLGGSALRVTDKMPSNFLVLGLIHAALPNARIIHMTRDPRDTCLSIYATDFASAHPYSADLEDLAHYYQAYRQLMDHWRSVLPPASLLEVPYEGLVGDTEPWSRRMVEFIGLDWDPRCLDFHATSRLVTSPSRWQVREPIRGDRVGRWRHYEPHLQPLGVLA